MKNDFIPEMTTLLDACAACFFGLKRRAKRQLAAMNYDLTMEQVIILHILEKHEGLNIKELAEMADRDKTTISRMIMGLEKKNLVVRVPDKQDARQKLVYMTHKTKERLAELAEVKKQVFRTAYVGLDQADIDKAQRVVEVVVSNLMEK